MQFPYLHPKQELKHKLTKDHKQKTTRCYLGRISKQTTFTNKLVNSILFGQVNNICLDSVQYFKKKYVVCLFLRKGNHVGKKLKKNWDFLSLDLICLCVSVNPKLRPTIQVGNSRKLKVSKIPTSPWVFWWFCCETFDYLKKYFVY